jgi:hypothetical protein
MSRVHLFSFNLNVQCMHTYVVLPPLLVSEHWLPAPPMFNTSNSSVILMNYSCRFIHQVLFHNHYWQQHINCFFTQMETQWKKSGLQSLSLAIIQYFIAQSHHSGNWVIPFHLVKWVSYNNVFCSTLISKVWDWPNIWENRWQWKGLFRSFPILFLVLSRPCVCITLN